MTLEKAIKTLSFWEELFKDYHDQRLRQALKLGSEALKGIQSCRQYPECPFTELLPGETKE